MIKRKFVMTRLHVLNKWCQYFYIRNDKTQTHHVLRNKGSKNKKVQSKS